MRLAVIGAGYVGLVVGTCLADAGNHVVVVDRSAERVERLRRGEVPVYEPGLEELLERNLAANRIRFAVSVAGAVADADVVFLAVGTPPAADGTVDLTEAKLAVDQVARAVRGFTVIATKSTVPVGFHQLASRWIREATTEPCALVSNPEFLKEGTAVRDFLSPDRVVIGTEDPRAIEVMRHLYSAFMRRNDRLIVMDPASAEMTKYACNAMLATRVSFMNEIGALCERTGADVSLVRQGMGADPRIGPQFLYPSLGYGGSCLSKDIGALIALGRSHDQPMRIAEATRLVNAEQRERFFEGIRAHFEGRLSDRRIAVWGLAFKANTDDIRESAAIALVERLLTAGATVVAHDPKAMPAARDRLEARGLVLADDPYDALEGADALVVCTEWPEYRSPDFELVRQRMRGDVLFDGRNLYDLDWMASAGLRYVSLGRRAIEPAGDRGPPSAA